MPKLIAICGKICSGKSYYARELKQKENAVILSTDEATFDLIENEQGDFYNVFAERVNKYLRKKAAEIVDAGASVILDWGFWTKAGRKETTEFFAERGISVEWHYINIEESRWKKQIDERNKRIKRGEGSLKLQSQNVSTFEDCNSVRASGQSNKSVSQETEVKISGDILDADFKRSDFFVDEGLLKKMESMFEVPSRDEIDVWVER